jgi:hypothetical protein
MLYQAELLPRGIECKSSRQLEFAPAELSCGLATMTISAPNVALLNLVEDDTPRSTADHP